MTGSARAVALLVPMLGIALALAACTADEAPDVSTAADGAAEATQASADPSLATACTAFWGEPDYADPLSREVLDRAGSAPEAGPSDPAFYAMTGDDVEAVFADAPAAARESAATLAEWFRTEPERGEDTDLDAFARAWDGVAGACRDSSAAALWADGPGEAGTKPAALVCADVFDTPGTLTHFANSNVLTSNMFKLVGRAPQQVPQGRADDLRATAELLAAEITAVDDDAVRAALEEIRAPFADALDGDTSSDGLQDPLDQLASACVARGYDAPAPAEDGGDAVVGAPAAVGAPAGAPTTPASAGTPTSAAAAAPLAVPTNGAPA
jgi:hypothetical protein